ncbi:hypothetical protein SJAV_18810 [Sulfurisphaera javensis]|uniref:Uncharacterized protein n=1 Tax=Sulfurisphaera javensis TaxID=2049879 RepID=A0AAT9GSP5_9CREN
MLISISKPSIIIAPYYVIKTLKEWDLIVHNEKLLNEQIVITKTKNLCEERVIGINPYDISSKLFQKKLIAECGKDHKVEFAQIKIKEYKDNLPIVMYKSEAEKLSLQYLNLGLSIDFYVSLFKNATDVEIQTYENIRKFFKNII